MTVDLVVKEGRLVLPWGIMEANIVVDGGTIESITRTGLPEADRVINASGNYVLPGMIDMHVHLRDPGFPERENFESGTRAAAAGGVTTVVDMPNTVPATVTVEALDQKRDIASKKSLVDYALLGGAGELSPEQLIALAESGVTGYKTFLIARFKELAADDYQMLKNFEIIESRGLPCLVHAENQDIVDGGVRDAEAAGRTDPMAHCEFRPPIAEAEATQRTILFADLTGVHLHICHMTCRQSVDILENAKNRGQMVTGETSTNYLFFTEKEMDIRGPYVKVDPPLRKEEDRIRLWEALNSGTLDVLASDHAPYTKEEKEKGWENIFDAPSGGVVVETTLPLMLDAVNRGRIGIQRFVEVFSEAPAKINGLYPRKGGIVVGADADLTIVDMEKNFTIRGENLHSLQKITPYEGISGKGEPIFTILRGSVVVEEGEVLSKPGSGEWLTPL
ncbi:MAG: allantoinase AllB [Candidatus Bathyarchaeia archaeon]